MPAEDFEVIFVDDGSPDDTWQRLKPFATLTTTSGSNASSTPAGRASHATSVWSCPEANTCCSWITTTSFTRGRSRRVMRWPRGPRRCPERQGDPHRSGRVGDQVYTANMDNAIDRHDIHPLIPTNPHKLFRREFLMEHHIRFPEGRQGAVGGCLLRPGCCAARRGDLGAGRHAVLPLGSWSENDLVVLHAESEEYWHWVREIVQKTNDKLSGPTLEGRGDSCFCISTEAESWRDSTPACSKRPVRSLS